MLCLSQVSLTSTLTEFRKDQSSNEPRRDIAFASYSTAVTSTPPSAGGLCLGNAGVPGDSGLLHWVTDLLAQVFLEAGAVLLPMLPFM